MQNQFLQRFNQGQVNFDSTDQGTWQQPMQMQQTQIQQSQIQQSQIQEDTYFTGSGGNNSNYYTNQQSGGGSAAEGMSPVFSTGAGNYKSMGSKGLSAGGMGNNQSQYSTSQTGNNAQFMSNQLSSMQDRSSGKMSHGNDDGDGGYYGFPNESYMTNSGGNMMGMSSGNSMTMGMSSGNSVSMPNMGGGGNQMNFGNSSSSMNVGNAGNINMMGNYGSDNMNNMMMNDNNMGMDNTGNFGNTQLQNSQFQNNQFQNNQFQNSQFQNSQFQSQIMAAAVGIGALGNLQNTFGNNTGFNNARGNFGKRGKRGRGGFNHFKGEDMFYHDGGTMMGGQQYGGGRNNLSINLSATNHNQWCFLRKNFNKRDNDLVEHLFDIHEKFCHHCKDRYDDRKQGKKRKYDGEETKEPEPAAAEEEPEEEMTEEELEMKKLMGFAGFKTTKGSRVKDNNYSTMSSVNATRASEAVDETTTLTEAEKKMIASIGGFSVFSKTDSSSTPGFGAPAVTFEPIEGSGPGYSNEPLFGKTESQNEAESQETTENA